MQTAEDSGPEDPSTEHQVPAVVPSNETPPECADVYIWVTTWLTQKLERELKRTFTWCPVWWDHPEAVERLTALWCAWEYLRLDGTTGMSTWWVDHGDPQLTLMCNPDIGPFGHCGRGHFRDLPLLATADRKLGVPAPPDWASPSAATTDNTAAAAAVGSQTPSDDGGTHG